MATLTPSVPMSCTARIKSTAWMLTSVLTEVTFVMLTQPATTLLEITHAVATLDFPVLASPARMLTNVWICRIIVEPMLSVQIRSAVLTVHVQPGTVAMALIVAISTSVRLMSTTVTLMHFAPTKLDRSTVPAQRATLALEHFAAI